MLQREEKIKRFVENNSLIGISDQKFHENISPEFLRELLGNPHSTREDYMDFVKAWKNLLKISVKEARESYYAKINFRNYRHKLFILRKAGREYANESYRALHVKTE